MGAASDSTPRSPASGSSSQVSRYNSCAVVTLEVRFIFVEQACYRSKQVSPRFRFLQSFLATAIESSGGIGFMLESAPIVTRYLSIPRRESCVSEPSVGTFCMVKRYGIFMGLELGYVERVKQDGQIKRQKCVGVREPIFKPS